MNTIRSLVAYVFSAFIGATAWIASVNFLPEIRGLDAKVLAAVVTVCGTLITGVVLALLNHTKSKKREIDAQRSISERELEVQRQIREREIEESHRERKVAMYLDFVELVSSFMQASNPDNKKKALPQQHILDRIEKFQNGIILWGGPKVLKAYLNYRVVAEKDKDRMFESVDNLYQAIRSDIGLSNEGLNDLEIIQLHLKDPTEINRQGKG